MNRKEFHDIIIQNIIFDTEEEKKNFFDFYDELISDMLSSGKKDDEIFESLNVDLIIQQYNNLKRKNYKIETQKKIFKTDIKVFNCSIIIGLLLPIIFIISSIIILFVKKETIDFWNHNVRLIAVLLFLLFYEIYFKINEIYFLIRNIKIARIKKTKLIVLFVAFLLLSSVLTILLFFLCIHGKIIIIFLLTLLLFTPYIFFIIKKRRINHENNI